MKSILIIEDDIIFSRTIGNWLVKHFPIFKIYLPTTDSQFL